MRLIDADKLLDEMMINVDLQCNYDDIKHIIDNLEPKLYVNDDFLETHIANITTVPQGDLISREALKKCAIPCELNNGALTELCVPLYQIDNAPTVELDESIIQQMLNKRCTYGGKK